MRKKRHKAKVKLITYYNELLHRDCYHCGFVDKVMVDWEGVHCGHGHLEGKDAWLPKKHQACEYFKKYQGKLN